MIRLYKKDDYLIIRKWWEVTDQGIPTEDMLPLDSTFVMEKNGKPWICATLYLTNSKEFAMIDNLIANTDKVGRKESVELLIKYIEKFAKELGYKKLFCMSTKEILTKRYSEMGYKETCKNVSTLIKEI